MNNTIHPTAIIDPNAKLGHDNYIGPYCIIGPNVVLGSSNRLESHVVIGTAGAHRDYFLKEPGPVKIGNNNIFREFVVITGGTKSVTVIGDKTVLLMNAYVGHDATLRDGVNLGNNVALGGHTVIGIGANLGLATVVHQYRVVGAYAMIGMNSTITRDMIPFTISFGSPCRPQRVNRIGLERAGVSASEILLFEKWFTQMKAPHLRIPSIQHSFQKFIAAFEHDHLVWNPIQTAS